MTSMFWGLRLDPGKRYSTTVGRTFHVSMAALDHTTVKNPNEINCVMLQEGESDTPFILCNLQKEKNLQCPLDLNFQAGDRVTFYCKGNGTVHLSGYVHDDIEDMDDLLGEEEMEEEDEDEEVGDEEEDSDLRGKLNGLKRQSAGSKASAGKKIKLDSQDDDEDDTNDEESGEEEESDDDESVEEEEVDDEEEEVAKPEPKKKQKQEQKQKKQNGISGEAQPSKKEKKKADKQATTKAGEQKPAQNQSPVKKTIEGGVQIKDLRVGNGAVAKPGQKVQVYYIGRLKSNNKVFDSTKKGNGFAFGLGKGEVIKGWDAGISGMRVGGKRMITCPPSMAYGQRGSPPTIPPNSTLVFEVELRAVN